MRRVNNSAPTTIDGNENPVERFAEVYSILYIGVYNTMTICVLCDGVVCAGVPGGSFGGSGDSGASFRRFTVFHGDVVACVGVSGDGICVR